MPNHISRRAFFRQAARLAAAAVIAPSAISALLEAPVVAPVVAPVATGGYLIPLAVAEDFMAFRATLEADIIAMFGVPPALLGPP